MTDEHHPEPWEELPDPPEPRVSPLRVAVAVAVAAALLVAALLGSREAIEAVDGDDAGGRATWFAPYVDVTLDPPYPFQSPQDNPARDVALGFVVAAPGEPCEPSWGGYHSLDEAETEIDLDRRVAQLRGRGGSAIVSFGGQRNSELAVACDDVDSLTDAYARVVDRYDADTVDLDVEGAALTDSAANVRRGQALAGLQRRVRADGGKLAIWLTLPVTGDGLRPEAIAVADALLAAGVDLAGVNVMALDFGDLDGGAPDMLAAAESAAEATHDQLAAIFARHDLALDSEHVWRKLGITVMIGQNDVDNERFAVADAEPLVRFARDQGVGRVSIWSLNRDRRCGVTFATVGTHSNLCSGVAQAPLQFSKTFARLRGSAVAVAGRVTSSDPRPYATAATRDIPARSPYPIWQPTQAYPAGYKVVWHRAVYEAKWYTQGQTPDAPATGEHAWMLIGPVLRTDRAPDIPREKPGTYPAWSAGATYRRGDRVLLRGLPYEAKWFTVGDRPGTTADDTAPSPWKALFTIPGEPGPL